MANNLVIVESPSKALTIKGYLGSSYKVIASIGHVRDLPKSSLGVDIEHGFDAHYISIRGKGDLIKEIRKEAKAANKIYLATDPDREGEAISWHLAATLGIPVEDTLRICFNEVTKTAVKAAIKAPRQIDMNLVNSQQTRRILDRIVGYKLSPLLWKNVKSGLSAGRVQTVATRIIVEREEEIRAFVPVEYWTIESVLHTAGKAIPVHFWGDATGKVRLSSEAEAMKVVDAVRGKRYTVSSVKRASRHKAPAPPFTTSTMQQEAAKKLGFQSQKIMKVAQELYEGVNLGAELGGTQGLITYMRTDSLRVSADAQEAAQTFIKGKYGEKYYPSAPRVYKTKAGAQDAHEAIRPSRVELEPTKLRKLLSNDQYKLYKLIWERFLASQMAAAVFDGMQVNITNGDYCLKASGSKLVFDGYQKIYAPNLEEDKDKLLPEIEEGEELKAEKAEGEQKFTEPPARFTEASLVKELEERNIGRPSTYAPIIATILERKYIVREKKVLVPTDLGFVVTGLMEEYFKEIVDAGFTAEMEDKLDDVEAKDLDWKKIIRDFYGPFKEELDIADKAIERVEIPDRPSDEVCEVCGKPMVIKSGRFGDFLACSGYPECKNTKAIVKSINVKCPDCGRDIVAKRGRSGKIFYGCSGYPECTRAYWYKPTNKKCPECGELLLEKHTKTTKYACSNAKCGYKE